jgi:hypothetical protein
MAGNDLQAAARLSNLVVVVVGCDKGAAQAAPLSLLFRGGTASAKLDAESCCIPGSGVLEI